MHLETEHVSSSGRLFHKSTTRGENSLSSEWHCRVNSLYIRDLWEVMVMRFVTECHMVGIYESKIDPNRRTLQLVFTKFEFF